MNKKKPLLPPDRDLPNMDTFPDELWMQPWRTTVYDADGNYARLPPLSSADELPSWMSPAAKQEVMAQVGVDENNGSRWWKNMWEASPSPPTQEFMFLAAAMAATYGWPRVVSDLLDQGAPLTMDRPAGGWKWLTGPLSADRCNMLDICVHAMRGFTATTPLHAGRAESLQLFIDAGADVNELRPDTHRMLMGQQAMALLLIDAGLDPRRRVSRSGEPMFEFLFSEDRGVSANVHGRLLRAFIKAGMPVRPIPDGPSLPEILSRTTRGLGQFEILFEHPDREGMLEAIKEVSGAIEKKSKRMNDKVRAQFHFNLDARMIELNTPLAKASRSSPRL